MKYFQSIKGLSVFLIILLGCSSKPYHQQSDQLPSLPQNFGDYWYQGEAEITSYELRQARYGDYHEGNVVMIFVTEPFLKEKQVKADNADDPDATTVLKLNQVKNFPTGIYDYSMMRSVFTPVSQNQYPGTLKITGSSQDWCGQSFFQINQRNNQYHVKGFSYFESRGDMDFHFDKTYLEDELWTFLRLNPDLLPTGEVNVVPGVMAGRLSHQDLKPMVATAKKQPYEGNTYSGEDLEVYTIAYEGWERTLKIIYENEFPYKIAGWEETYESGFGDDAEKLTTRAKRKETLLTDYWNRNAPQDSVMRDKLKLGSH